MGKLKCYRKSVVEVTIVTDDFQDTKFLPPKAWMSILLEDVGQPFRTLRARKEECEHHEGKLL